jgi:hypothetical protein
VGGYPAPPPPAPTSNARGEQKSATTWYSALAPAQEHIPTRHEHRLNRYRPPSPRHHGRPEGGSSRYKPEEEAREGLMQRKVAHPHPPLPPPRPTRRRKAPPKPCRRTTPPRYLSRPGEARQRGTPTSSPRPLIGGVVVDRGRRTSSCRSLSRPSTNPRPQIWPAGTCGTHPTRTSNYKKEKRKPKLPVPAPLLHRSRPASPARTASDRVDELSAPSCYYSKERD